MEKFENLFNEKTRMEGEFKKAILNDEYVQWLTKFADEYGDFDDVYFAHNYHHVLSERDLIMLNYLEFLHKELNKYAAKRDIYYKTIFSYALSYKDKIYVIEYHGEGYSCIKYDNKNTTLPCIEYNDLKREFEKNIQVDFDFVKDRGNDSLKHNELKNHSKKNMHVNFEFLKDRVIDSLEHTDLEFIRNELSKLEKPTIFSGVGGSSVVSEFGAKVINRKNGVITINSEPRDFIYRNNDSFKNVVSCSYSGNNYGVELSFLGDLKKYLLSNNSFNDREVTYLKYDTTIDKEESFVSLASTLIPVSILMNYYLNGKDNQMLDSIEETYFDFDIGNNLYEIFTGYDTNTASKYLESTIVESGIGIPIVHDKYSYCHGRSTFGINYNGIAIYYNRNTAFDKIMLEELKRYYKTIIIIDSKFHDQILDDYQMLIQSMYLTKYIAERRFKDLSKVNYSPIVKKLYKYNGNI